MIVLYIVSLNLNGEHQEYSIGHSDFDSCFNMLSGLAESGFQLLHVNLSLHNGNYTSLPIEAIDGEPLGDIFRTMQNEWETILFERK